MTIDFNCGEEPPRLRQARLSTSRSSARPLAIESKKVR